MKMFYKKDNCLVDVYHFFEDKTALIFSPVLGSRQNGNGWAKIKIGQLIPEDYYDKNKNSFMSKTERNKIKEKLTLTHAIWTCTDGTSFEDCDKAIEHERLLNERSKQTK